MSSVLDPLGTPRRRIKWICKILCFVDYLTVLEFHNADRVAGPSQVHDRIFSDPQVAGSEEPPDLESRGLAGMMAAQDPLTGLRVVADGVVG